MAGKRVTFIGSVRPLHPHEMTTPAQVFVWFNCVDTIRAAAVDVCQDKHTHTENHTHTQWLQELSHLTTKTHTFAFRHV